jgi:hypothetical protein
MNPGVIFHTHRGIALALAALIAFAAAMALAPTAPASAQAPAEISGTVENRTEGGVVPEGMTVRLFAVDETTQSVVYSDDMVVDSSGAFSFTGFPAGDAITYRVVADDGSDYTPSVDLTVGASAFTGIRLTTWDATESLDDITISRYSILVPGIDREERLIGVLVVATVSNSSDKVWIPDLESPTLTGLDLLRFNLPEGFQELAVESELPFGDVLEIGTGFALTNPVPPGDYDILMTYGVGYDGDSLDFPLRLPYGAGEVRIILPEGSGAVTGLGLGASESVIIEDTQYNIVTGKDYPRDSQLDVTFSGLPKPTLLQSLQSFLNGKTYILVVIWIVVVVILGLLAYAFVFARKTSSAKTSPAPAGGAASEYPEYADLDRGEIVKTIAELDGRHDTGEIGDEEYRGRRDALKGAALAAGKRKS